MRYLALLLGVAPASCGRLDFEVARGDAAVVADGAPVLDAVNLDTRPCTPGVWTSDLATLPAWSALWTYPASGSTASASVTGGELVVAIPTELDQFAGLLSQATMDFTGRRQRVRVTRVPAEGSMFLGLDDPGVLEMRMTFLAGEMVFTAPDVESVAVPFDPLAQPFWQLREVAGTVYFDVSSNGAVYTPLHAIATPGFLATSATCVIGAGTPAAIASAETAAFDDLVHCDP